uniref:Uncharacterized protein n=1 Tax=Rhizophora mucronata TaxID=61149 RepID=A0A2P2NRK8_RHIMU
MQYPKIIAFQETRFLSTILSKIPFATSTLLHLLYISINDVLRITLDSESFLTMKP